MSASFLPVDPALVAAKAAELRDRFQGRETITLDDILPVIDLSRMTAYRLAQRGEFIPRANPTLRANRYTVVAVATYLIQMSQPAETSAASTPKQNKKMGRPRKVRSQAG